MVPIFEFDHIFRGFGPKKPTARLFVEFAPPTFANVRLGSPHFAIGQKQAADLNATIFAVGGKLYLEFQPEILEIHLRDKELVLFEAITFPHDFFVFYAPKRGVSDPVGEVLAIEKEREVFQIGQDGCLARMTKVAKQTTHFVLGQVLQKVIGHHGLIRGPARFDIALGNDKGFVGGNHGETLTHFLGDNSGNQPPIGKCQNGNGIFLGNHGAGIEHIFEKVIQVGTIGTGEFGADFAPRTVEDMAGNANLLKEMSALGQVHHRGGFGIDQKAHFFDSFFSIGRGISNNAPDFSQLAFQIRVPQITDLPDQFGAKVVAWDFLGFDSP